MILSRNQNQWSPYRSMLGLNFARDAAGKDPYAPVASNQYGRPVARRLYGVSTLRCRDVPIQLPSLMIQYLADDLLLSNLMYERGLAN
jgi:hypothetical protein